jgi:hypothetical protein
MAHQRAVIRRVNIPTFLLPRKCRVLPVEIRSSFCWKQRDTFGEVAPLYGIEAKHGISGDLTDCVGQKGLSKVSVSN